MFRVNVQNILRRRQRRLSVACARFTHCVVNHLLVESVSHSYLTCWCSFSTSVIWWCLNTRSCRILTPHNRWASDPDCWTERAEWSLALLASVARAWCATAPFCWKVNIHGYLAKDLPSAAHCNNIVSQSLLRDRRNGSWFSRLQQTPSQRIYWIFRFHKVV